MSNVTAPTDESSAQPPSGFVKAITLTDATTLAGMFPRAGGPYVLPRESFNPLVGFLYGWTLLAAIQTGMIAAVGVALGRFLGVLVAWEGLARASVWTALLCLGGTYGRLLNYVIFANLAFYVLATAGLFVLRAKRPVAERPYRVVGYPIVPGLYLAMAAAAMLLILMSPHPRTEAVSGLVIVAIGIPVYFLWRAVEKPSA